MTIYNLSLSRDTTQKTRAHQTRRLERDVRSATRIHKSMNRNVSKITWISRKDAILHPKGKLSNSGAINVQLLQIVWASGPHCRPCSKSTSPIVVVKINCRESASPDVVVIQVNCRTGCLAKISKLSLVPRHSLPDERWFISLTNCRFSSTWQNVLMTVHKCMTSYFPEKITWCNAINRTISNLFFKYRRQLYAWRIFNVNNYKKYLYVCIHLWS